MAKFSLLFLVLLVSGCVSMGQGAIAIKTYANIFPREQVGVLRLQQRVGFKIFACDGLPVYNNSQYILLLPGRHLVNFQIVGQTLLETFSIINKKYIDVQAGHTYILITKGGGLLTEGDKWFPQVMDVTSDPKLNVVTLPLALDVVATKKSVQLDDKFHMPTMDEGLNLHSTK